MVPLRFISDPPSFLVAIIGLRWTCPLYPKKRIFAVQKQRPLWVTSRHLHRKGHVRFTPESRYS
jgi:hypothetical protein